jgi:sulfite reductase (NADPH) hemoprotein beta-component
MTDKIGKSKNESIKNQSNFLRGTIKEGLQDVITGALSEDDTQLTKFHGTYQQDDRDLRGGRRAKKMDKAYSFMIRVRVSGGVCTPKQWLDMDYLADNYANHTLKLTTRQVFQFHGVIKNNLRHTINAINKSCLDTLAACGDVNRTVMSTSNPDQSELHADAYKLACDISTHLLPRTSSYHELWVDDELVAGKKEEDDVEPIYGKLYLPRKFKIVVAVHLQMMLIYSHIVWASLPLQKKAK